MRFTDMHQDREIAGTGRGFGGGGIGTGPGDEGALAVPLACVKPSISHSLIDLNDINEGCGRSPY